MENNTDIKKQWFLGIEYPRTLLVIRTICKYCDKKGYYLRDSDGKVLQPKHYYKDKWGGGTGKFLKCKYCGKLMRVNKIIKAIPNYGKDLTKD